MSPLASGGGNRYSFDLSLDRYVCYPMETAVLTVQVKLSNPARTLLCVHLPKNLDIEWIRMDEVNEYDLSVYITEYDGKILSIPLAKYWVPGTEGEVHICFRCWYSKPSLLHFERQRPQRKHQFPAGREDVRLLR